MIFTEKFIVLKDGRTAVLRAPTPDDSAQMIAYLKQATAESEYLANYPEEIRYTVESEAPYLENTRTNPNALMIVCDVDGVMAGNCQIQFMTSLKTKHRAEVAIALLKPFWGLGIGSAMFAELLDAASARGISQLELELIEGNDRAMALYRKMGFEVTAELPDAFRLRDGSSRKAIFMVRRLNEPHL